MNDIATPPRVLISPPTGHTWPGRGFYQLEEEALYVQIGPFGQRRPYFSTLESEHLQLEIDREGCLQFIGVHLRRRLWQVVPTFPLVHQNVRDAAVRWLDFRAAIPEPDFSTDPLRISLMIQFGMATDLEWYTLADHVVMGVDASSRCRAIRIDSIEDDLAGQEIAAFRRCMVIDNPIQMRHDCRC